MLRFLVNLIWVVGLSLAVGVCLDQGISVFITYYYWETEPYASFDAPTFQSWKEPIHSWLLLCNWVAISIVIIIWRYVEELASIELFQLLLCCDSSINHSIRFFAVSYQPSELPFMVKGKNTDHHTNKETQTEADDTNKDRYINKETQTEADNPNKDRYINKETQTEADNSNKDHSIKQETQTEEDCHSLQTRTDENQCTERKDLSAPSKIASPDLSTSRGKKALGVQRGTSSDSFMSLQSSTREHKGYDVLSPAFSTRTTRTNSNPFVSEQLLRGANGDYFPGWKPPSRGNWDFISPVSSTQASPTSEYNESLPCTPTRRNFTHEGLNAPMPSSSTLENYERPPIISTGRLRPRSGTIRSLSDATITTAEDYKTPPSTPTGRLPSRSKRSRSLSEIPISPDPGFPDIRSCSNTRATTESEDSPLKSRSSRSAVRAVTPPRTIGLTAPLSPSASMFSRAPLPIVCSFDAENNEEPIGWHLRQEIESWGKLVPERWEDYLVFRPLSERSPKELAKERRRLEEVCAEKRVLDVQPFRVYGTRESFDYDRLKCWVLFNQHLHDDDWPKGYVQAPMEELSDGNYKEEDEISNAESDATFW